MGKRFEKRSLQERWDQRARERDMRERDVFAPAALQTPVLPAVETIIESVPGKSIKASPVRLENGMYAVAYEFIVQPVAPPPPQKTDDELVREAWQLLNRLAETCPLAAFVVLAVRDATNRLEGEPAVAPTPVSEQVARGRRYFKLDD